MSFLLWKSIETKILYFFIIVSFHGNLWSLYKFLLEQMWCLFEQLIMTSENKTRKGSNISREDKSTSKLPITWAQISEVFMWYFWKIFLYPRKFKENSNLLWILFFYFEFWLRMFSAERTMLSFSALVNYNKIWNSLRKSKAGNLICHF